MPNPRPVIALLLVLSGCASVNPCEINRVPIEFTTPGDRTGVLGGMVVPIEYNSRPATLAIDTGSALTFLYLGRDGPRFRPDAGSVHIGCETLRLPGRNLEAEDETGAGIVGVLGADFFLSTTTLFDPGAPAITRYHAGASSPPGVGAWTAVPFENVEGHILVTLTVDGLRRRLMWDTGSPHILLIGESGRDGDEVTTAMDVEGGQFPIYVGEGAVAVGAEPARTLTVMHAPSFPYFEGTVRILGGNIDGLAGQSLFARRRILFEPGAGLLRVGPED